MKKIYIKYIIGIVLLIAIVLGCLLMMNWRTSPGLSQDRIKQAYLYCCQHNMNKNVAIFVDYSIHSGKNRFIVYDFQKKKVILSSLCTHGNGGGSTENKPVFSNQYGSNCSSLGMFKVGRYITTTRAKLPAFLLDGLSATNSNARKRQILIHPYYTVCDIPTYPFHAPMNVSQGCFVISPLKFQALKTFFQQGKPVLLWAYVK